MSAEAVFVIICLGLLTVSVWQLVRDIRTEPPQLAPDQRRRFRIWHGAEGGEPLPVHTQQPSEVISDPGAREAFATWDQKYTLEAAADQQN